MLGTIIGLLVLTANREVLTNALMSASLVLIALSIHCLLDTVERQEHKKQVSGQIEAAVLEQIKLRRIEPTESNNKHFGATH